MIYRTTAMYRNGYGNVAEYIATWKPISDALSLFGWVQTNDTGQVEFATTNVTITGTSLTANVAKYFAADTTGLRIGQSITIANLVNNAAVFNITATITGLSANKYFTVGKTNADIEYASDTGIGTVPVTNTYPSVAPKYYYQIWRMDDDLQATNPIYLKFGFGGNSLQNGNPQLAMWVGTGTNNAGSLTNSTEILAPYGSVGNALATATTLYDCLFSGDASRLGILMWRDGYCPLIVLVERSKDVNGDDTDEGTFVHASGYHNTTGTFQTKYAYVTKNLSVFSDAVTPTMMASFSSSLRNGSISVFPLYCLTGGVSYPMRGSFSCKAADFVELDEVSLAVYNGVTNNYIFSAYSAAKATARSFGYSTNNGILMRYD